MNCTHVPCVAHLQVQDLPYHVCYMLLVRMSYGIPIAAPTEASQEFVGNNLANICL